MMMTTLEVAALVIAFEFAIAAWLGPVLMLRRKQVAVQGEKAEVAAIIEDVEAKEPTRRDALATIFTSTYQLEGDELEQKIDEFVQREQAFYQVMTSVYLERDAERLKEIPEALTKVISPWLRMTPSNMVDASAVDELAVENSALQEELDSTKRSMDELMEEYLAAFDKAEKLAQQAQEPDPVAADDEIAVAASGESTAEAGDVVNEVETAATEATVDQKDTKSSDVAGEDPEQESTTDSAVAAPDVPEPVVLSIDVSDDDADDLSKDDLDALFAQDLEPSEAPAEPTAATG